MRIRKLQRKNQNGKWFDDAYALENNQGEVSFRYNLTWERLGSDYNHQIRTQQISLEKVGTIIRAGDGMRWLDIEAIDDQEVTAYLNVLDKQCCIPQARPISLSESIEPRLTIALSLDWENS